MITIKHNRVKAMKKHLYKLSYLSIFIFLMTGGSLFAFGDKYFYKTETHHLLKDGEPEKSIKYSKSILNQGFDFDLQPVAKGKFRVSFLNESDKRMDIRVYDIIGNLILEETVRSNGTVSRVYDLSYYKSQFFVVEIGNAKYNKTKSIIAG